jgi:outer membrane protein OmpU
MNNLKKLGVSALAASLTAVSAQAVEMSVNGYWELTHKSQEGQAGNGFGSKSALEFSGSGDVNGMTASVYSAINDNTGGTGAINAGLLSHLISLDMGDMGTVGFDQGVGEYGFATIDDKSPTAYEESWHATSFSASGLGATGGSAGVLGYKNSVSGINVSIEFSPDFNETVDNGDGNASGAGSLGSNTNFAITTSSLIDGLDIGVGAGENSDNRVTDGSSQDQSSVGGYANYAFGAFPVTVGYTQNYTSGGTAASSANAVTAYGIAFNVNENLSISYNEHENEYKKTSSAASGDGTTGQADVTQKSTGIAAAYTMGAAALRIQNNDIDNVGGASGTNEEITEVSLFLTF